MAQTEQVIEPKKPDFELPEDSEVGLSIAFYASGLVMQKEFTKVIFKNEVLVKQVQSVNTISRDVHASNLSYLRSRKDLHGRIGDIADERVLKRPPNWLVVFVVSFGILAILAYGQYNQVFSTQLVAFWNLYNPYIVVGGLLLIALALYLRRRRRQK